MFTEPFKECDKKRIFLDTFRVLTNTCKYFVVAKNELKRPPNRRWHKSADEVESKQVSSTCSDSSIPNSRECIIFVLSNYIIQSDKEDRDDIAFWEQQKKEYLQLNPTHHQMIAEFEAEVDTAEDVYMEDVVWRTLNWCCLFRVKKVNLELWIARLAPRYHK